MKRVLRILVVVTGTLLVLLLAAEVVASFTEAGNAAVFVEDPDTILARKPDNEGFSWGNGRWIPCHINKDGLRGADLPEPRDPAETWVLCIGDSFTFGGGVETNEAWPQQIQQLIGPPEQSRLRVLNGGANGWWTMWQRLYLEKKGLDRLHPDVVVLGWNWNDLNTSEGGPEQSVKLFIGAEGSWLSIFAGSPTLRDTHLYRWLYCRAWKLARVPTDDELQRTFRSYRTKMEQCGVAPERKIQPARRQRFGDQRPDRAFWEATDTSTWKSVRAEMARIQALCSERGVAFVVAALPEPTWDGPGTFPGMDRLAAMLDDLGVPWVDLQPAFLQPRPGGEARGRRPELWLRYDPVHPTAEGQRLFAEAVTGLLREKGLVTHKAR